jgi:hypothetical protein
VTAWPPAVTAVLAAAAWFAAFVLAHVLGWRAGRSQAGWLLLTYAASLVGMLVTVASVTLASHGLLPAILAAALATLISACLFVVYVPAVYTVLTSLSVQTMLMLRRHGGAMAERELYDRFAGRAIVRDRLATLVASGYLVPEGGTRFRLTPRGRSLARAFAFVKALWKLGPGG